MSRDLSTWSTVASPTQRTIVYSHHLSSTPSHRSPDTLANTRDSTVLSSGSVSTAWMIWNMGVMPESTKSTGPW